MPEYMQCTLEVSHNGELVGTITCPRLRRFGTSGRSISTALSTYLLSARSHISISELTADDRHGQFQLGPQLAVLPGEYEADNLPCTCWDPYTNSVVLSLNNGVLSLDSDLRGRVVEGDPDVWAEDFPACGAIKISASANSITSDGEGALYFVDYMSSPGLHKLQLPPAWRAAPVQGGAGPSSIPNATTTVQPPPAQLQQQQQPTKVQHTPLLLGRELKLLRVAYDPSSRSLVLSAQTALYRMPVDQQSPALTLLAGHMEDTGYTDGAARNARFEYIDALVVDAEGVIYAADVNSDTAIRRVAQDGTVTTVTRLEHTAKHLDILPDGCLAVTHFGGLTLLQLGLKPNACQASYSPACTTQDPGPTAPARTLAADLGSVLSQHPEAYSDVTVVVGERRFPAHRLLLCARCEYFRQRLDPAAGFADGAAAEVALLDADPRAFETVLRYIYTDAVPGDGEEERQQEGQPRQEAEGRGQGAQGQGGQQGAEGGGQEGQEQQQGQEDRGREAQGDGNGESLALLKAVGELADRLLLPRLCELLSPRLLARVGPDSVVGLLLWAEARSGSFGQLLAGLRAWFEEHRDEVVAREEDIRRLMAANQGLAYQLFFGGGSKRRRV